jgi:hypothetical protein
MIIMKKLIFTFLLAGFAGVVINLYSQSPEGSTGWEDLMPGEPLVLEDNFQDFPFFHSDSTSDMGASSIYKDTTAFRRCIGSIDTVFYEFTQCAFAPSWIAAYAYQDSVTPPAPCDPTPQITRGFVEISREAVEDTVIGHFIIDLRQLEFVEAVQWSHSSCGGNKRGFTLAKSLDDGETWDTVRYQHAYPNVAIPQPNSFNCQNSACGMRWEDGIWESNVMLRFTQAYGQAVRIQDLKVYGTAHPSTGINDYIKNEIKISWHNGIIRLSEVADVVVYNMNGTLVIKADQVETLSTSDLTAGMYIVKARTAAKIATTKIVIE